MDIFWIIRSSIFFIAGLIVIIFPKRVNKFQNCVLETLHIKHKIKSEKKSYFHIGIIFIITSILLFAFSITH